MAGLTTLMHLPGVIMTKTFALGVASAFRTVSILSMRMLRGRATHVTIPVRVGAMMRQAVWNAMRPVAPVMDLQMTLVRSAFAMHHDRRILSPLVHVTDSLIMHSTRDVVSAPAKRAVQSAT
jgi:hypothetical protein